MRWKRGWLVFGSSHGNGFANLPPAGESPLVREIPALFRLYCLKSAVVAFEKFALAVGLLKQRQPLPVLAQSCVLFEKSGLGHVQKLCDGRNLFAGHFHFAGPLAAVGTALAGVGDGGFVRHARGW